MSNEEKDSEYESYDCIIVGGGINGLAIGAMLSFDGYSVLLIEKEDELGGRTRVEEKVGFVLEKGLHLIKYGWKNALNNVLRHLKDEDYERLFIHPIRHYYLYVGNQINDIKPNLYERFQRKWFNRGWISVPSKMKEIRKHNYFSAWNLMKIFTTGFKCDFDNIKDESLRNFIDKKNIPEIAARYLKLAAGVLLHCPYSSVVSAGEVIRHIKWSSKQPVLYGYPSGGWGNIIERLRENLLLNGQIKTGETVESVVCENTDEGDGASYIATGVKTDKGQYRSKYVITAIPPKQLPPLFENQASGSILPNDLSTFIDELVPTCGLSFDIALNERVYRGNAFLYTENPNGYGIFLSNLDPSIAPDDKQLFRAFIPLSPKRINDTEYIQENINKSRDYIYGLFPKMKDHILFEDVEVHELVDSCQVNTEQHKNARPDSRIKNMKNVYMVGDFINAYGSGGELGYNSIWKAYRLIKKSLNQS